MVVGAGRLGRLFRCFAGGGTVARPGSQAVFTGRADAAGCCPAGPGERPPPLGPSEASRSARASCSSPIWAPPSQGPSRSARAPAVTEAGTCPRPRQDDLRGRCAAYWPPRSYRITSARSATLRPPGCRCRCWPPSWTAGGCWRAGNWWHCWVGCSHGAYRPRVSAWCSGRRRTRRQHRGIGLARVRANRRIVSGAALCAVTSCIG